MISYNDFHTLYTFTAIENSFIVQINSNFNITFTANFFLLTFIFIFFSYGILLHLSKEKKFPDLKNHYIFLFTFALLLFAFLKMLYLNEGSFLYNTYFVSTNSSSQLSVYMIIISIIVLLSMYRYNIFHNLDKMEYYLFFLSSIFALTLLMDANEIISFFFIIELQSITSYILTGFNRKNRESIKNGIRYFIIGSFFSISIILGLIFFYSITGSTSFEDLKILLSNLETCELNYNIIRLGIFFFTIGIFGKLYISPLHWWIVDVYEGAPSTTTLFFSTIPFYSFYYILFKFYVIFFSGFFNLYIYYFLIGSIMSMFIGSIGGIFQKRVKRLFAYSSINSIGYLLALFTLNDTCSLYLGIHLLLIYTLNVVILFIFFYNGSFMLLKKNKYYNILYIEDFYLLRYLQSNKWSKYILSFSVYSILGLPPMPLFFQKLYILEQIGIYNNWYIAFFFVFISIISGFYYLYIIKELFYNQTESKSIYNTKIYSLSYNTMSSYLLSILLCIQFHFFFTNIDLHFNC